ncbi:MAG: lipid asymmetry maintenance protein MlaB [Rickettsiales bacterium]
MSEAMTAVTLQPQPSAGQSVFTLPSHLTIETADELATSLKEMARNGGPCLLDACEVMVMTTPGLQLMISLAKTMAETSGSLHIQSPPESMERLLVQSGFGHLITPSLTQE